MRSALSDIDWSPIDRGSGDDAATYFMEMLWIVLCTHIPYEQVAIKKKSHPWLNTRCEKAIKRKNDAEGSATFDDTRAECSQILVEEHLKYIAKLKAKISKLKKGSKQWWRLNRQLLNKRSKLSSVPPLREGTAWVNTPNEKTDLFAKTFASKTVLPPETCRLLFLWRARHRTEWLCCVSFTIYG